MSTRPANMIPTSVPSLAGNERAYLNACIDSGFVSSVGAFVDRFETELAEAADVAHAVCCNSGTSALHLGLILAGVQADDLVISPNYTFIATANAIRYCGAQPWLMDCDPANWTLAASTVAAALAENCHMDAEGTCRHTASNRPVRTIMPVFTMGMPIDLQPFLELARTYNLNLLVDAAAALGAKIAGTSAFAQQASHATEMIGFACSFNGNKTITSGGGGALLTQHADKAALAKHLSTTARSSADYDYDAVGYNYRMTNIQAAVGVAQLEQLPQFLARKAEIYAAYRTAFDDMCSTQFPYFKGGKSANWLSGIVLPDHWDIDQIRDFRSLLRDAHIDARPFWKPISEHAPYAACLSQPSPHTDALWKRVCPLPCSVSLTTAELDWVLDHSNKAFLQVDRC